MAKLMSPTNVEPACIPTPDFKDSGLGSGYDNIQNVQLAGYGKYFRPTCLTDELGPEANHYCESKSKCNTSTNPTVQSQGGKPVDCFRKTSYLEGSEGWCLVTDDATQIEKLSQTSSWGFCSRDCFLKNVENVEPHDNDQVTILRKICENSQESSTGKSGENVNSFSQEFLVTHSQEPCPRNFL